MNCISWNPATNQIVYQSNAAIPIQPHTWYTLRIEIIPDPLAFNFYLNNRLFETYTPEDTARWQDSPLTPFLSMGTTNNQTPASAWIDYVLVAGQPGIYNYPDLVTYDDFEDPAYFETSPNPDLWQIAETEECSIAQNIILDGEGATSFVGTAADVCRMVAINPQLVSFDQIGVLQSDMYISSSSTGNESHFTLQVNVDLSVEKTWSFTCGFLDVGDQPIAFTEIYSDQESQYSQSNPLEYDQWYTFRLEINSDFKTASCFVDDVLLGHTLIPNVEDILELSFERGIIMAIVGDPTITGYIDNVQLIP
jgi:hypothetical protein